MLSITARVELDGRGFEAGIRKVDLTAQKFAQNLGGNIKAQLAQAFAVGAVAALIKSTIALGGQLKDTATRMEVSTDAVQQFSFSAKQAGSDLDLVAKGIENLRGAMEKVKEGGVEGQKLAEKFARFGITLDNITARDPETLFRQMATAMETMNLEGSNGEAVLDILGHRAGKLIPVMKELRENSAKAPIISAQEIENLDKAGDILDTLTLRLKTLTSHGLIGAAELLSDPMGVLVNFKLAQGGSKESQENEVRGNLAAGALAAIAKQRKEREAIAAAEASKKRRDEEEASEAASVRHQNEQDEILKLNKETADKQAENAFKALSADEKRVALAEELRDIQKEINSGQAAPGTLLRAQLDRRAVDIETERAGIKDEKIKVPTDKPSDSLIRVGNFLGTGSNAILSIQQKQADYLRQIVENTKGLRVNSTGGQFAANTP